MQRLKVSVFFNEKKTNNLEILKKIKSVLISSDFTNEISESDVCIAVGGDGTIIDIAKKAAEFGKSVIGVNNGKVGFLSSLKINDIRNLDKILTNDYKIDKRIIIETKVSEDKVFTALNDFVIARNPQSGVMDFNINNTYKFCADGIIIATPTGSTAYSLSAGGPILEPSLSCAAITPICPISYDAKSIILGLGDNEIRVDYTLNEEKDSSEAFFSVDGHVRKTFKKSGSISIKKSEKMVQFIRFI